MKAGTLALFALICSTGCSQGYTDYYFTGRVYNGAAGTRILDYDLDLQFLDRDLPAMVDKDGRYVVGPLRPFNDYTIEIRADGFRPFLSHNLMKVNDELTGNANPSDDNQHPDESQYFDAYLFPTDVVSSAVTFHITAADSTDAPSGTIRLRPTTSSSLTSTPADMPAGVGTQVWLNDEDLQFSTVTRDFTGGVVTFSEGDLVYGVTYAVTVYNVAGHGMATATYTAGVDGDLAVVVPRLGATPLSVSFLSTQLGTPVASGELVIILNQPVTLDPLTAADDQLRSLEANFSIDSPDANMNGQVNTLKPFDPAMPAGSRGVTLTVDGNKVTLGWQPSTALMSTDAADPIRSVTYGGLDGVIVRPVNGQVTDAMTLQALVGTASITVPVTP